MNRTLVLLVRTLVWGIVAGASALSVSIRPVTPARAGADAAPGVIAFVTSVNGREDQIQPSAEHLLKPIQIPRGGVDGACRVVWVHQVESRGRPRHKLHHPAGSDSRYPIRAKS